jgi:hypothetical protein
VFHIDKTVQDRVRYKVSSDLCFSTFNLVESLAQPETGAMQQYMHISFRQSENIAHLSGAQLLLFAQNKHRLLRWGEQLNRFAHLAQYLTDINVPDRCHFVPEFRQVLLTPTAVKGIVDAFVVCRGI